MCLYFCNTMQHPHSITGHYGMSYFHYKKCLKITNSWQFTIHSKLRTLWNYDQDIYIIESKIQVCIYNWTSRAMGWTEWCGRQSNGAVGGRTVGQVEQQGRQSDAAGRTMGWVLQQGGRTTGQEEWWGGKAIGQQSDRAGRACYELPSRHSFLSSYQVTDGFRLCKHPVGCLMGNTW